MLQTLKMVTNLLLYRMFNLFPLMFVIVTNCRIRSISAIKHVMVNLHVASIDVKKLVTVVTVLHAGMSVSYLRLI